MSQPIELPLETARLSIRPLTRSDAVALHELSSDPVAMQYPTSDLPATIEESAQWVQDKIDLHERTGLSLWAVVEKGSGRVVGDAGLQRLDNGGTAEIAARIMRSRWGRGYGCEAATAHLDAGFGRLSLDRIIGITAPGNATAIAAMVELGMTCEGLEEHFGRTWVVYVAHRERTVAS
ncbi:MAG TPA: GNAT family N-acetyltransferase [Acidimicrobiia bacterium]|nr:GNAT family N-acetyltransferase [Acidimicrobiia bacterium]